MPDDLIKFRVVFFDECNIMRAHVILYNQLSYQILDKLTIHQPSQRQKHDNLHDDISNLLSKTINNGPLQIISSSHDFFI